MSGPHLDDLALDHRADCYVGAALVAQPAGDGFPCSTSAERWRLIEPPRPDRGVELPIVYRSCAAHLGAGVAALARVGVVLVLGPTSGADR